MSTEKGDVPRESSVVLASTKGGFEPISTVAGVTKPRAVLTSSLAALSRTVVLSMSGRCVEKGCVFPAALGSGGRCIHHHRQQQEPGLYSSLQPSCAVAARGKFGPSRAEDGDHGGNRDGFRDRRRMVVERERFLTE